jgi:hypothetical protein
MAQDLVDTHPEALSVKDGYYQVDYSVVGFPMITIKEYNEASNG